MAEPMKFVKAAGSNVKLECRCGRVFWYNPERANSTESEEKAGFRTARCPDCKIVWNGVYTTVFEPPMKKWIWAVRKEAEWMTLGVFEAIDFKHLVIGVQESVPFVFHNETVTGMHFAEIDEETFRKLKVQLKDFNDGKEGTLDDFLKLMWEELLSARSQGKDPNPPR